MEKRKNLPGSKNLIHLSFELGLLIKGIDGFFETIGGILLLYLNPRRMNNLVIFLTHHKLSEDPKDLVANALIQFGHSFSIGTQYFGVFYLITHGVIKCVLVFLLWRKKLWAYPVTIFSLLLFIAYQIYRFSISHSLSLVVLTIFDALMIVLTFIEYKRMKTRFLPKIQV
jgi:uncharacterized membrane protein